MAKHTATNETYTLTGGDVVRFHKIKPGIVAAARERSQIAMMQYLPLLMKLGINGNQAGASKEAQEADDMATAYRLAEVMDAAGLAAMSKLMAGDNREFIEWGVELVSPLPDDKMWVRLLRRNGSGIDWDLYDLENVDDQRALYVRYVAFGSESDWELFYIHTGLRELGYDGGFNKKQPAPAQNQLTTKG